MLSNGNPQSLMRRVTCSPGARLVVFLEETQERAQVYRDRDGTDPYPLGEVVANEWGYAYFYAAPDSYRITSAPLAIDWREVVVAGEWLLEAEGNAAQSAAQALLSAQSATASAATASDSAAAASDSAANAESSETSAAASATSAQGSATQASSSAADAANSASSAAQSASDSASHADSAQAFSQDAESSKTLAEQWAQNPEDVPVTPGLFSAFHWARKAMEQVVGVLLGSNNLSDLQDIAQARVNLGLGSSATRNVGTAAGTVAAGDDSRIVNAVPGNNPLNDININTLGAAQHEGIYNQTANANATTERGYPIGTAGTLIVTRSAYGCQQMYISFSSGRVFVRGLWSTWNGSSGPWYPWTEVGGSADWASITGKPSTFPPSTHTHPWSQVTGAPATATRWPSWGEVTGKPSGFMPPTSFLAVGSYVYGKATTALTPQVAPGGTFPGSRFSTSRAGTWRYMHADANVLGAGETLIAVRIS